MELFKELDLPIPKLVYTYSEEKQKEIADYLKSMDNNQRKAYLIALDHLESSFNICKSNGFKEWKNQKRL
jgi:hypothetical protein